MLNPQEKMKLLLIKNLTVALLINTLFGEEKSEILIWQAAAKGDIELVRKHLSDGVNVKDDFGKTPIDGAIYTRKVLLKHGGKTWEELKAEGK